MGNHGRLTTSLFVALVALIGLGMVTGLIWTVLYPQGEVIGTLNTLEEETLTIIDEQRQVLAVQLRPNGRIQTHLQENGLTDQEIQLDYRQQTAVSLHLPQETIHDFPTIWPIAIALIIVVAILTLLFAPTRFETKHPPQK